MTASSASVDVVIPSRNGAATIVPALESVLNQSVLPRRIIVVDDGSDDGTAALAAGLDSPLIEVITTPAIGVSHARNVGIQASRATFVAFLDCDDQWHPEKLRRQLQVFAANERAVVVVCGHAVLNPSMAPKAVYMPHLRGRVFRDLVAGSGAICPSIVMVRRAALLRAGGFDERLNFGEDDDLWLRLAKEHEFDTSADVLSYVMANPDSVTRRQLDESHVAEMLLQYVSVFERRCADDPIPFTLVQRLRKLLVRTAMLRRLSIRWLLEVRAQLAHRAPRLSRKIWPNHASFVAWVMVAVVARIVRTPTRWWLNWRHDPRRTVSRGALWQAGEAPPAAPRAMESR